jgi:hypothetical protein
MSANAQVSAQVGPAARVPRTVWIGRTFLGLVALFLLLDGGMHVAMPQPVVVATTHLGFPLASTPAIGVVELACLLLFLVPATAPIGAVLLTGLLGGAVAAHVRVGDPFFETYVFPVIIGALIWGALGLRDARVRALCQR